MPNIKLKTTVVYKKLEKSKKKIIVMQGSARSSKTYSILQFIIIKCLEKQVRVVIAKKTLASLKDSILVDFKDVLTDQFNLWSAGSLNERDSIYKFPNGSIVKFQGLQDHNAGSREHGVKYDYAFINECSYVTYDNVEQILIRLGNGQMFLDFNPCVGETFWVYTKILKRDDSELIHSTFLDNPFLDEATRLEILRRKPTPENIAQGTADITYWRIYGLGQRAQVKGLIFPEYSEVSAFPVDCENVCYGMDFGFTNDPTTLVKKGELNGELYFEELLYKRGLTSIENSNKIEQDNIERHLRKFNIEPTVPIYADSSEPAEIQDLCNCGFNVVGAKKPAGSIIAGINTMKSYKLNIVSHSEKIITELNNYKWRVKRDGSPTNEPVDDFNHAIDAMRYTVYMTCKIKDNIIKNPYAHCKMNTNADRYSTF